ncbi:conserved hypothetical protein [Gammaproteobacteria bacterium]
MYMSYKLDPSELNENFIQSIKLLFTGNIIEIIVRKVDSVNESNNDIWPAIQRFRQQMNSADFPENEDLFTDVRDRSAGREVVF